MARRPPRGFSSWKTYNRWREGHGAERGLTLSQSRGKPKLGETPASQVERIVRVIGPDGPVEVQVIGVRQSSRAAAYDSAVRALLDDRIDERTYNRRWAGKQIGDVTLPDAARVLALGRAGQATFTDFYPQRSAA